MAKEASNKAPTSTKPNPAKQHHPKLPKLPSNQKIQKRPLLHAPVASVRASSQTPKIIYVSASTPFISTVKRVRAYLSEIESRASGPLSINDGPRELLKGIQNGVGGGSARGKRGEEVLIKGTGRAIEKVVRMAAYWGRQSDVVVRVGTGSVGAVDDVVARGDGEGDEDAEDGEGKSLLTAVNIFRDHRRIQADLRPAYNTEEQIVAQDQQMPTQIASTHVVRAGLPSSASGTGRVSTEPTLHG
ncbi:hypothetical protein MBM_09855 [Drepanopeziza brunnea f. sp. 'multigermtubi' MB_m1]|uniref:Uncharacterized protein n=1 Tax=Marssonina brunnea f. sp. multigermtubi (strain MB_m1) TaxID=1072389 RepID=K1WIG4_MARBU|nr:uncharacterized protein MBM_09855 [Drepanopeziza brunnea f. sp. 'multigermtubi' MB_m1]EKD11992.1 hypothetical protein MBM_09855 [Drepanopeziza brunnea f. sp. 'multigermtubi' MB_m1]